MVMDHGPDAEDRLASSREVEVKMSSWRGRRSGIAALSLSVVVAVLLAACGGGGSGQPAAPAVAPMAAAMAAVSPAAGAGQRRALAVEPENPVDATALFDWAEWKFPSVLPKGPASVTVTQPGLTYVVRAYATGNYLAVTAAGAIYGLGPATANQLLQFGSLSDFAAAVLADRCSVYPQRCGTGLAVNECQPLVLLSTTTGTRFNAELALAAGADERATFTLSSEVLGSTNFEGQIAVRTRLSGRTTFFGPGSLQFTQGTNLTRYVQPADGGLLRDLGEDDETIDPDGLSSVVRRVLQPPAVSRMFTLAPGQSITETTGGIESGQNPPKPGERYISSVAWTFEARETLTLGGKAYDTCRYLEVEAGSITRTWFHVGTGVPVKLTILDGPRPLSFELVSASVNGEPL